MSIPVWLSTNFAEDAGPSEFTVRRLLREGKLPGRKVGGEWYVDRAAWLAGDDPLVQNVLQAG